MKTIGLIGGMSWESTTTYYRAINEGVKHHLGGLHSAKLVLVSLDFAEIERLQHADDWQATADILIEAAQRLQAAGVDAFMICTNTMHKVADQVAASVDIPLLHLATVTAEKLVEDGVKSVALLGTAFTMEQDFYTRHLREKSLTVLVPEQKQRAEVHRIIYQELCLGRVNPDSKAEYLAIIESLKARGADAVILGCTEIGMLVDATDSALPVYDTTAIHCQAAVDFILA